MMTSKRVKSQSLGMPPWYIPEYFKKTQVSKLGDAQGIPFDMDIPNRYTLMRISGAYGG